MFRIDRRFVKLTGIQVSRMPVAAKIEADAQGENPEAAASMDIDDAAAQDESLEAEVSPDDSLDYSDGELDEREEDFEGSESGHDRNTDEDSEEEREEDISAEEMVRFYMSSAEKELEERSQAVMNDAREKAAAIVAGAEEQAREERKRGYEEGFAEGSDEGKKVYEEKLLQQRQEDEKELKNVLGEIARERERANSVLEAEAADLAVEIVRKIFNPAQEEIDDVFIKLIKNALRQLAADSKFVIRVAPGEYERFFSSGAAELDLGNGTIIKASVLRDAALDEGGLIIDADDVTINAGLESQLKYVKLAFEEARGEGKPESEIEE